jgi:hypothetical protein
VTTKPGEAKGTVALRVQNLASAKTAAELAFSRAPKSAARSDPIEHRGSAMQIDGGRLAVELAPLEVKTVLVDFGP